MALTITTPTDVPSRSSVPATPVGLTVGGAGTAVGMKAVLIAWDTSYPTGGETADFSSVFPTCILGAWQIGGTVDDEGCKFIYCRAAAGAPATGVIQAYYDTDPAAGGGANTEFVEVTNTDNLSAATAQVWLVVGY